MPTASEIRKWAGENGYLVEPRGNVPKNVREAYDAAHPGPNGSGDTTHPDYPDSEFEALFVDPPDDDGEAFDESVMEETAPVRPKARSSRTGTSTPARRGRSLFRRGSSSGAKKPAKKKPRVSTENLLGGAWNIMAKIATPLPPLHRTLRIQAPVAGLILEDVVKDTAADTFLQPLARIAGQGKAIGALVGPPFIVAALTMHAAQRASMSPPQEPNALFVSLGIEALRSSLLTWAELTEGKILVVLQREREIEERFGQSVDDLIALILAPAAVTAEESQAEEDAIRRAQGIVVDA